MLKETLIDLKDKISNEYSEIYSPVSFNLDFENRGVSEIFLESAEDYHNRYTNYPRFKNFLERSFSKIPKLENIENILDIGSGSGNTLFPLFELFPNANITATDISPQLLRKLKTLMTADQRSRTKLLCMDLYEGNFIENQFDLIIGAAILHHLFDPAKVIEECFHALRPGGWMVFFEPFEVGNSLLKLCYTMILNQAGYKDTIGRWSNVIPNEVIEKTALQIPEKTAVFLINFIADLEFRKGEDKSSPLFQKADDKWLFTNSYFQNIANKLSAKNLLISQLEEVASQFTNTTLIYFKIALNQGHEALPQWAWDMLSKFDQFFSAELQKDLYPEAMVLLQK